MERLSPEQSGLLHLIAAAPVYYDDLNDANKVVCDFLIKRGYLNATKRSKSSSGNGIFRSWTEYDTVSISEDGKMYLINEKLSVEQTIYLQEQMQALRDLADTAIASSVAAKKDARFSKVVSVLAIIISIAAIIIPLILR